MKVLYIVRDTFETDPGGDTVQALNTASELRLLNVTVDIHRASDSISYAPYDLIHFFNIIRPSDILKHIRLSGKPYVVSTIFVDYSEYERNARKTGFSFGWGLLSSDQQEYIKILAKRILKGIKIVSPQYLLWGHRKSISFIMKNASYLLPNSENEYTRLVRAYGITQKHKAIPNGINPVLFGRTINQRRNPYNLLCVGRIEGRKNQLNLIKAVNDSNYHLTIIGKPAQNQHSYYLACKKAAGKNIQFLDKIPQSELIPYYQSAKVHILPSWFETTGLSSLEAAYLGCNLVITDKGDTREYFGDHAFYCNPSSIASIRDAIDRAAEAPLNETLIQKITEEYTWSHAAFETLNIYNSI